MSETETTFLLVRHGATAHTAQRRFSGCTGDNPPLSDIGERQAAALARNLPRSSGAITAVVASPVLRAAQTAQILADALSLPLNVEDDLREIDFGHWEGLTAGEIDSSWPGGLDAYRADADHQPPGGEAVSSVATRVRAIREQVAAAHPGATVLIVSHLYPVRLSVLDALGAPLESVHRMSPEPTGVSEVSGVGNTAQLLRYNDFSHLSS